MGRAIRKIPLRTTVAIVGDGLTERIYFQDIKETDRPAWLAIFPDMPKKLGSYHGVLDRAIHLKESHSRVYALVDMDSILTTRQQSAYERDKKNATQKGVIVLENNPCFEIWLLLHFVNTARNFTSCAQVINELHKKGRLEGYEKTEKYLVAARLYGKYKALIPTAAKPIAEGLEADRDLQSEFYPRAQLYQFFDWYEKNIP